MMIQRSRRIAIKIRPEKLSKEGVGDIKFNDIEPRKSRRRGRKTRE